MPFKTGKNEYIKRELVWMVVQCNTNYDKGSSTNKGAAIMTKLWEMLDQAYYYIGKNRPTEAQDILDQVLSADPQNMDAWDAYIHICNTQNDLEGLRNHIVKVWNSEVRDRDYLLATQRFVLQRLEEKMNSL
jgi:Tfp pilus assembly protein PilF